MSLDPSSSQSASTCPRCHTFLPAAAGVCPICGWQLTSSAPVPTLPGPAEDLEIVRATLAAEYDVREELGRGGMAIVYRAREHALDRDVAIKVLPLAHSHDAALVERFQREARTAAQLTHPHIIPIHRVGQVRGVAYFAMAYLSGPSLARLLRERGRLACDELRYLLIQVADALHYAAQRGVVHRDIKPDNILLDDAGRYVVTDFGIAKAAGSTQLTEIGVSVGTPRYMSPEQAQGQPLDGRSDLYSLGIVAYQCLVGRPPYDLRDSLAVLYAHVNTPLPRPELRTKEERELFAVIERLAAKDPAERFQAGADVITALGGGESERRHSATSFGPGDPTIPLPRARDAASPVDAVLDAVRRSTAPGIRRWTLGAMIAVMAIVGVFALRSPDGARARCEVALAEAPLESFVLLVEAIASIPPGAPIALTYDVCGLERGVPYTARLTMTRTERGGVMGGVRRLFGGGPKPLTVTFDEVADGFATARRRDVDLGTLEPGSYRLVLVVTDARGRRRERSHGFVILEP